MRGLGVYLSEFFELLGFAYFAQANGCKSYSKADNLRFFSQNGPKSPHVTVVRNFKDYWGSDLGVLQDAKMYWLRTPAPIQNVACTPVTIHKFK